MGCVPLARNCSLERRSNRRNIDTIERIFPKGNVEGGRLASLSAETPLSHNGKSLPERLDRGCLVVLYVKNGVELGDLQQVVDLLRQVQQLQFAALVANCCVGAD